jgi:hypothetical protein
MLYRQAMQVGRRGWMGIEIGAAVIADFGAVVAQHVEGSLRQRREVVISEGAQPKCVSHSSPTIRTRVAAKSS